MQKHNQYLLIDLLGHAEIDILYLMIIQSFSILDEKKNLQ